MGKNVEISSLLEKAVIVESTHEPGEFISSVFVRLKKGGSHRMILNLKNLNKHVHKVFCTVMRPNCFIYSLNRFEGRLLLCPHCTLAPKVPEVLMGREAVSISLFSKWVSLLSSKIYQTL